MDIVERLRREEDALDNEAADEIERLREQERKMTNHALERMEEIERLREALKEVQSQHCSTCSHIAWNALLPSALQQKESE